MDIVALPLFLLPTLLLSCGSFPTSLSKKIFTMTVVSCSDPYASSVINAGVHQTRKVRSLLACAISCNNHCAHAIFRETNYTCDKIQVTEDLLVNYYSPMNNHESCMVLTRTKDSNHSEEQPFFEWNIETLRSTLYSQFLPLKVVQTFKPTTIYPASYISTSNSDFIILNHEKAFVITSKETFKEPLYSSFDLLIWNGVDGFDIKSNGLFLDGSIKHEREKNPFACNLIVRDELKDSAFVILTSIESLKSALLKGYRLIQQGPYSSRVMIDTNDNDVHFDTTQMFVVSTVKDMQRPMYFTSVKESAKSGTRYTFRHRVFKSSSLSHVESKTDGYWVVDTKWTKVEPKNPNETLFDALKENILEGKDVRLVIDREISADVTSIKVTQSDVIATLTKYITPFKGKDVVEAGNPPLKVRFPVFAFNGKKLPECETTYNQDDGTHVIQSANISNVDWYISSRHWTKIFEMKSDGTGLFGNLSNLYIAAEQGYNIRVCVMKVTQQSLCHGASAIYLKDKRDVILESPSCIRVRVDDNQSLKSISDKCQQMNKIVSTSGLVKYASFSTGKKAGTVTNVAEYEKQTWFVEDMETT